MSQEFTLSSKMDPATPLKLELDTNLHQEFVFNTIQSLRMSDYNLLISCMDGGTVFTNKRYLGVYCSVIKDICREFPEHDKVTVYVEFKKKHVEMMMEYFNTGELKSDNIDTLNYVESLIQTLGVNVDDMERIEVKPPKKYARKRKSNASDSLRNPIINSKIKIKSEPQDGNINENADLDEKVAIEEDDKVHGCGLCGKRFAQSSRLTMHLLVHTKEKPYECKECRKFFSSPGSLFNHSGVHNPTKCNHCDKTFAQKASLNHHMKTVHSS